MSPRRLILSALLSAVVLLAPSAAVAKAGTFTVLDGAGQERRNMFTAGAAGAVVAMSPNIRVRLSPDAEIWKLGGLQKIYVKGRGERSIFTLLVHRGKVTVEVAHSATKKYEGVVLRTSDKLSALVSEGTTSVVSRPGLAVVANHSGDVMYSLEKGWRSVSAGTSCTHRAHADDAEIAPLLAAPDFELTNTVAIAVSDTANWTGANWRGVPQSTGYEVVLRRAGSENPILVEHTSAPRFQGAHALPPGEYSVTVRALDSFGVEGLPSAPLPLSVVGIEPPAGGYVKEDGTIRLPPGTKARLTHAEGLEASYGHGTHWIPANSEVGLFRGERTLVHLRRKGFLGVVSTTFSPRSVRAEIVLGPAKARWPRDEARIAVRLVDAEGGVVPRWLETKIEVAVGITGVNVAWAHRGDTLQGRVAPRSTPGPWVLRVNVTDQFGVPLGYNFLEIEPMPNRKPSVEGKLARNGA